MDEAHDIMAECYGTLGRLEAERDSLRQQLAERDADIIELARGANAIQDALEAQRDKLAEALREVKSAYTTAIHWEDMQTAMAQIDAALSELTP